MDLKEFISQTLVQIAEGVAESSARIKELGGSLNPVILSSDTGMASQEVFWGEGISIQLVKFDVALTVNTGAGTKGGIGIFSGAVNLGSSGESRKENSSVSHVSFTVPLALPKPKA